MTKHTLGPLHVATGYTQVKSEILDDKDFLVAECFDRHKGNAHHIAKCVNCHDGLLKACKMALPHINRMSVDEVKTIIPVDVVINFIKQAIEKAESE